MGTHVQDLKVFEKDAVIESWVNRQLQTDLDKLGLGLSTTRVSTTAATPSSNNSTNITPAANSTTKPGEMCFLYWVTLDFMSLTSWISSYWSFQLQRHKLMSLIRLCVCRWNSSAWINSILSRYNLSTCMFIYLSANTTSGGVKHGASVLVAALLTTAVQLLQRPG